MIRVNLLEIREELRRTTLRNQAILMGIVWIAIIGGMVTWHTSLRNDVREVTSRTTKLKADIEKLKKVIGEVEKIKKEKEEIEKKLGTIRSLDADRKFAVLLLSELARITPETLWLTLLDYSGEGMKIEGEALDTQVYGNFIKDLRSLKIIEPDSVRPGETKQSKGGSDSVTQFKLEAKIVRPTPETFVSEDEMKGL